MDVAASAHSPFTVEYSPALPLINHTNNNFSGTNVVYDDALLNLTELFEPSTVFPDPFNASAHDLTTRPHRKPRRRRRRRPKKMIEILLKYLDSTVIPIALSLGIVGSIMSVLVFNCTPLKTNALCHYFTASAVSDCIYSISSLIVWLSGRGVNFYYTIGVCQVTMFALLLSRFLATWYLFTTHAERFMVHFSPGKARKWCSTFRAKCFIITIFVFSMTGFLHYIWMHVLTVKYGRPTCMLMEESMKHVVQLHKIEIISALFLPMFLILLIDATLCVKALSKFWKRVVSKRARTQSTRRAGDLRGAYTMAKTETLSGRTPGNGAADSDTSLAAQFNIDKKEKVRATILVVITGAIFICLVLPSAMFRAKSSFGQRPNKNEIFRMRLFEEMFKCNSMYKFFLYVIFLRTFRSGIIHLFKSGFRRKRQTESLEETTV